MIKLAEADLLKCCGSRRWSSAMAEHSFPNAKEVMATADSIWWGLAPADWREAFEATVPVAGREHLAEADPRAMAMLRDLAPLYQRRFGRQFVATTLGKTAAELLKSMQNRIGNDPVAELRVSAEQQLQITHNRLKRLLGPR